MHIALALTHSCHCSVCVGGCSVSLLALLQLISLQPRWLWSTPLGTTQFRYCCVCAVSALAESCPCPPEVAKLREIATEEGYKAQVGDAPWDANGGLSVRAACAALSPVLWSPCRAGVAHARHQADTDRFRTPPRHGEHPCASILRRVHCANAVLV